MDGRLFDDLTRTMAGPRSRRRVVKVIAGVTIGSVLGCLGRAAEAATCRAAARTCSKDAHCCSGFCGPKDATGRRRCLCTSPADCPAPAPCHAAVCTDGRCVATVAVGAPCDDGDRCTTGDVCQPDGTCTGTPVNCPTCQTCNPGSGSCVALSVCEGSVGLGCNGNRSCQCQVTTEGTTFCHDGTTIPHGTFCGECFSSADCAAIYPNVSGVTCIRASETGCCAPSLFGGGGYCIGPCPG